VTFLGKRKVINEGDIGKPVLPQEHEVLGVAERLLGYDRITVKCQDGATRLCRIRGKMKRRVWIRPNDIVLVSPWDFQADTRGDIVFRYKGGQAEWLRSSGYLKI
jgi:translation initiation factor 1A